MSVAVSEAETLVATLVQRAASRRGAEPPWLRARREAALQRLEQEGMPTPRSEAWKYTNVAPLLRTPFAAAAAEVQAADLKATGCGSLGGPVAVRVNGRLDAALSKLDALPAGVEVASLRDVLARAPQRIEALFGQIASVAGHPFTALSTGCAEDALVIFVAAGAVVVEPLHLIEFSTSRGASQAVAAQPRVLVVTGRGSRLTLVESCIGPAAEVYWNNPVTEVLIGEDAVVEHCRVQNDGEDAFHTGRLSVRQERGSRFTSTSLALGARLARYDLDIDLVGEAATCVLNGLFMADGERLSDVHTRVDHRVPHGTSRQLFKGIANGKARGVFHGSVVVHRGAQKTDAQQTNKNLLLSRDALVDSTPALEILADDVKCKHGSTTGQLDDAALFYLRSRGIGDAEARALLTYAFASDVVQSIPLAPIRDALTGYLQAHLPGAARLGEVVA